MKLKTNVFRKFRSASDLNLYRAGLFTANFKNVTNKFRMFLKI